VLHLLSGFLVGQERAQQLVVGAERAPAGRGGMCEERITDLIDALPMRFWSKAKPRAERYGNL
jgi:hypothetical protein